METLQRVWMEATCVRWMGGRDSPVSGQEGSRLVSRKPGVIRADGKRERGGRGGLERWTEGEGRKEWKPGK